MKQNQNAVAAIDHECAVRIKSYVLLDFFVSR